MANNRTPRDVVTRDKSSRVQYVPPSALPEPAEHPDFNFRWVATHVVGAADPSNVSKRTREGWEPVKAEDHPELQHLAKSGNIEIGGLMLCKMPRETVQAREEYYAAQAQGQMDSVDNSFLQQNDTRMAKFSARKTTVSRGNGFGSGT